MTNLAPRGLMRVPRTVTSRRSARTIVPFRRSSLPWFVGVLCLVPLAVGCTMSAQGRNVEGVRHYQAGRYHEAIQDFQKALVANPSDADAYYNLGATYHVLGKMNNDRNLLTQSEGLYHQCLDLNAEHAACYRGLATMLVETDRSESAFTLLKGWASRNHYSADARIELARLYEEYGDKETASQYLAEALQLNSYNARAWSALGHIREEQGQMAQALANYQQAYQLNQFQPGVADRIATLQRTQPGVANAAPPPQVGNVPGSILNR